MPNKRTGMDYLDYKSGSPKKSSAPPKKKKKKKKDPRYNPFTDGRTPTSASQTTGP